MLQSTDIQTTAHSDKNLRQQFPLPHWPSNIRLDCLMCDRASYTG